MGHGLEFGTSEMKVGVCQSFDFNPVSSVFKKKRNYNLAERQNGVTVKKAWQSLIRMNVPPTLYDQDARPFLAGVKPVMESLPNPPDTDRLKTGVVSVAQQRQFFTQPRKIIILVPEIEI